MSTYITNPKVIQTIKENLKEIEKYENSGNLIRTQNKTLDNIYNKGKEIIRKLEFRRGARKQIIQINNTSDKAEILNHIEDFYEKERSIDS